MPYQHSEAYYEIIPSGVSWVKSLPIGIESFEKMITDGYYFVDKSLLIKDIHDLEGEVKLITRPRRFGKTLNMDMIRHFYAMDGKDLFEGLKIWEEKSFVKDHYHKYPVVFVTFKEIKGQDWKQAEKMLISRLRKILIDNLEGVESASSLLERYLNGEEPYEFSLLDLTEALYKHFKKRVILLIDEYDVPIEAAYLNQDEDPKYYNRMVGFMRNLLTAALKGNPYLEFAILTGVYRVAKESIFSGLNNVVVYSIFENPMASRFGFTEDEVFKFLKHYGLEEDMSVVRDWYNGYTFGKTDGIYNPWSIIYYVKERLGGKSVEEALQPYWINTSSNDLIIKQIESNPFLQKDLDKLLSGEDLLVPIDPFLSLREIDQYPSGVWTLLAHAGYLNAKFVHMDRYRVFLPNKEIEKFYKTRVMLWLGKKTKVAMMDMMSALDEAMMNGNASRFAKLLEGYIENSLSYFDIGYDDAERVYKAFVLGMLSMAVNGYIVETEAESGYGRVDVVVYPKDKKFGKYALVMELKKAKSEDKLEETAKDALNQIREKEYFARYEKMGFEVITVGISFYGKRVVVKCERE